MFVPLWFFAITGLFAITGVAVTLLVVWSSIYGRRFERKRKTEYWVKAT